MTRQKIEMPPHVREQFRIAGRKGGLRGSRADKAKAGKLGAAAMRQKLIEEGKAQAAQQQHIEKSQTNTIQQPTNNPAQ